MKERTGIVSHRGKPFTLLGDEVKEGQKAPNFILRTGFAPESKVTLENSKGKIRLLSVVPSLDTGVCEKQTIRFNDEALTLGSEVEIITVSVDLPPAQTRFCGTKLNNAANVKMLSDYADKSFGINYGILLKEWQVHGRAVFVIGRDDFIKYVEYCPKIEELPNFEKALEAVRLLI